MNQAELDGSIFEDSHSSSHITVKSLPTIGLKSLLKPSSSNSTSVWRKKPSKKIVFNDLKPSPIPLPPKKSLKEYLPMLLLLATQKLAPFLVFSNKLTEYKDLPRIDQQFIDHKLHKK